MTGTTNGIDWFEIGTDDIGGAERFYGEVFGWSFAPSDDPSYRYITTPAGGSIRGGLFNNADAGRYAVFYVAAEDTEAACKRVEAAGGSVLMAPQRTPSGLVFAHVLDPAGNRFGIFTRPA
jgi:uncharacterized protein